MKFNYQARTTTGKIQTGVVEAGSREAAFDVLKAHGLYVTSVEEVRVPIYARRLAIFERVSNNDIVVFSRELAIMFKSKVGLVEIFSTLAQQTRNQSFKEKITKIAEEVEGGTSLSAALAMFPDVFTPFYISMVKSGEASGKLTEVFVYLADYLEKESAFRSKITGAMVYPAFILVVFAAVLTIIITFVIPQLTGFLKESGTALPWMTVMVMNISDYARAYGLYMVAIAAALIFGIWRYFRTQNGKRIWNNFTIKMPLIGPFLKKLYLARFALNLSTLISGGLPIVQSLEITSEVVGNDIYKNIIYKTAEQVRKGEKMSDILRAYPEYVSPLFLQMVIVGEKTGTLDSSLINVVSFYDRDIDKSLDGLIKMLEPIMIILLGIIVGGLIVSVLLPIYSMTSSF